MQEREPGPSGLARLMRPGFRGTSHPPSKRSGKTSPDALTAHTSKSMRSWPVRSTEMKDCTRPTSSRATLRQPSSDGQPAPSSLPSLGVHRRVHLNAWQAPPMTVGYPIPVMIQSGPFIQRKWSRNSAPCSDSSAKVQRALSLPAAPNSRHES